MQRNGLAADRTRNAAAPNSDPTYRSNPIRFNSIASHVRINIVFTFYLFAVGSHSRARTRARTLVLHKFHMLNLSLLIAHKQQLRAHVKHHGRCLNAICYQQLLTRCGSIAISNCTEKLTPVTWNITENQMQKSSILSCALLEKKNKNKTRKKNKSRKCQRVNGHLAHKHMLTHTHAQLLSEINNCWFGFTFSKTLIQFISPIIAFISFCLDLGDDNVFDCRGTAKSPSIQFVALHSCVLACRTLFFVFGFWFCFYVIRFSIINSYLVSRLHWGLVSFVNWTLPYCIFYNAKMRLPGRTVPNGSNTNTLERRKKEPQIR